MLVVVVVGIVVVQTSFNKFERVVPVKAKQSQFSELMI